MLVVCLVGLCAEGDVIWIMETLIIKGPFTKGGPWLFLNVSRKKIFGFTLELLNSGGAKVKPCEVQDPGDRVN